MMVKSRPHEADIRENRVWVSVLGDSTRVRKRACPSLESEYPKRGTLLSFDCRPLLDSVSVVFVPGLSVIFRSRESTSCGQESYIYVQGRVILITSQSLGCGRCGFVGLRYLSLFPVSGVNFFFATEGLGRVVA